MPWRLNTWQRHKQPGVRKAYYMSLEFLIGRALGNHLLNLDIEKETREALNSFSVELEDLLEEEPDAGLGNGGLGRLAACFLDSCASLALPVTGYGLRYRYGMFRQGIDNGWQMEQPDNWLSEGHIWELERPELACKVHFGGNVDVITDISGKKIHRWVNTDDVSAVPYDVPVPGYANDVVNTLRLWGRLQPMNLILVNSTLVVTPNLWQQKHRRKTSLWCCIRTTAVRMAKC